MGKTAGPFPSDPRTLPNRCGVVTTFRAFGEDYQAPCIRQAGHSQPWHYDGVTEDSAYKKAVNEELDRLRAATEAGPQ